MTHFKIVCTGWKNWPWVKDTLASIDAQEHADYQVCVVDDASDMVELTEFIAEYCNERGWLYIFNDVHRRAVYNQVNAIRAMNPDPEDVIVFLDPDGDRFAHPHVLERLQDAYSDGSRLVYTQYACEPLSPGSQPSRPHPQHVIDSNSYREFSRTYGIYWNHLRTMKADLFLQMDDSDFQTDDGEWFPCGTDSAFMFPGMELARGRVKFLDEVLLIYRPDHELSDWKRYPSEVDRIHDVILGRQPKC